MDSDFLDQTHSITRLINQLREGDSQAADEIWRKYFCRLIPVAKSKLRESRDKSIDEEDILISVFDRFFDAAKSERFAKLDDRDDLWTILLMLTERKVTDTYRRSSAQKRDRHRVVLESEVPKIELDQLVELADAGPSPEFVAEFNEEFSRNYGRLNNETTRKVALLKLEGFSNNEISDQLSISTSTVERKLRVIRESWSNS